MSETLVAMTAKSFGCVGVLGEDGALAGIITDGDLRRHMGENLLTKTAGEVMTPSPKSIPPSMLASEALNILNDKKITSLFVVENGKPVGLVHIHDFLRAGVM